MPDKLARDSEVQKGSKQSHVNAARVRGKLSHLIRGDLPRAGQKSAEAIVVGGWGNPSTEPALSAAEVAKGQTEKELSRNAQDNVSNRHPGGKKPERPQR